MAVGPNEHAVASSTRTVFQSIESGEATCAGMWLCPDSTQSIGYRSSAWRQSGPEHKKRIASPSAQGCWPALGTSAGLGLWPKQ